MQEQHDGIDGHGGGKVVEQHAAQALVDPLHGRRARLGEGEETG